MYKNTRTHTIIITSMKNKRHNRNDNNNVICSTEWMNVGKSEQTNNGTICFCVDFVVFNLSVSVTPLLVEFQFLYVIACVWATKRKWYYHPSTLSSSAVELFSFFFLKGFTRKVTQNTDHNQRYPFPSASNLISCIYKNIVEVILWCILHVLWIVLTLYIDKKEQDTK